MDIQAEFRALLIKEIQRVEDVSLLRAIKAVLHYGLQHEGSIEQYNRELDEAEARIENGEYVARGSIARNAAFQSF